MKILIIQTAFIGDVVLATSIAETLHQSNPSAQIDMLVRKGNEGLLRDHPFIRTLVWNKRQQKMRQLLSVVSTVRKNEYDVVINVQRFVSTGLITALSSAKQTIGFDKNPLSWLFSQKIPHRIEEDVHEIDRNHQLISSLTKSGPAMPRLYPTQQDFLSVEPFTRDPFITISPASVWYTKQYPLQKWISFINQVPLSYQIFLLGGAGDYEFCEEIGRAATRPGVVNLTGKYNFLQSAALMKSARMNYANDSAPLHFASAMNAPATAIYCSTIPSFGFGPLSSERFIVQRLQPLYCRPCGLHGRKTCPEGHFKCALDIQDEQLMFPLMGS